MAIEKLVQVYRITEWRDGCVWKTEDIETRWVDIDAEPEGDERFAPMPTPYAMEHQTMRFVRDKTN